MEGGGALDLLPQIQALVSDKLQVVSYKWLSRNFSVSSNHAKRLLQEFVNTYGNELEVIYTLSGWSKNNPQTYHIKLASRPNIAEVKQEFKGNCSVQVYSIQAGIPRDPAVLWNAEYVQAEELFNQPSSVENCLRDNRFCGVSNSFVKRAIDGRDDVVAAHPMKSTAAAMQSKTNSASGVSLVLPPEQGHLGQSSSKNERKPSTSTKFSGIKSDKPASEAIGLTSNCNVVKESTGPAQTNKRKGQIEKSLSASGGSLANMWGRASTKSKPSGPAVNTINDVPKAACTTEAQICAREAADAAISNDDEDDDHQMSYRRESYGGSNRKRKFVMDLSDDEEENVVSLASPYPPTKQPISGSACNSKILVPEKKNLNLEEHKKDTSEASQESNLRNSSLTCGISLKPKSEIQTSEGLADKNKRDKMCSASTSPQRRMVLKTHTDERGREVTEVVWEGNAADAIKSENNRSCKTVDDIANRPPVATKAPTAGSNSSSNPASKAGSKKAAKGGGKDAKQGNILSFFKRV